jgi:hypothetical protein
MILLRARELAQSDRHHLEQPALQRTGEIGVPLHARHQKYAVRIKSILVHECMNAFRRYAKRHYLQRADNGCAHSSFMNPVVRQNIRLAFRRGCAVAAHGRNDKWHRTLRFPEFHHRLHDGRDVRNAPAANANGDASPSGHARRHVRLAERSANVLGNIRNGPVRK